VFREWSKRCEPMKKFVTKDGINTALAFNGKNIFYSTQIVRNNIPDMEDIEVKDEDKVPRLFTVKNVMYTQPLEITKKIADFMEHGRRAFPKTEVGIPQEEVNTLDIVLQQTVRLYDTLFRTIGRNYFKVGGQVLDLGFGKEVWYGTFSSVRPYGWKEAGYLMTLNVDVANKPATVACHMTNESGPGKWDSYVQRVLEKSRNLNLNNGLDGRDFRTLEDDLKGLKVRYQLPDGRKRGYRINALVKPANQQMIPDLHITVEEYFRKENQTKLTYPKLPCLWVGSREKTIYIPMEFCEMVPQAMPRNKKLADDAVANMIRGTAVKPEERKRKILEGLSQNGNFFKSDEFTMEFGMSIDAKLLQVSARILTPPGIQYRPTSNQKGGENVCTISTNQPGSWRPTPKRHLYVNGKSMENWVFMDSAGISEPDFEGLMQAFQKVGDEVGLRVSPYPRYVEFDTRNFDRAFEDVANSKPEMVMVCLFMKDGQVYDRIKTLGDNKYKIPTQCVQKKTLFKGSYGPNFQAISNIFLKMNSKLGGVNHALSQDSRPKILTRPVMIMGADVSHAAPESKGTKPSLAAVVASCDPKATKYMTEIRVQDGGQNEEIIQDMENLTIKLLRGFLKQTGGRKPESIIMYRDGVSEGQFLKVLANELRAIRSACSKVEQGYEPRITYVIVQKRHHTRFFPIGNDKYPKSGNVLAGTVVDQGINHPKEGDFYLVSHEGIQGTSRPTHYHVS
jgi:eukaryotic translation initiation factor 2C